MAAPRRIARLQKLIHEVAAETILRRLKDPRLGFVTVTRVKLSPDMLDATVFWSCLGTEAERRTSARALSNAAPWVQGVVGKALGTRVTPRLRFAWDDSLAKAQRLEDVFARLRTERGEAAPDGTAQADGDTPDDAGPADEDAPGGDEDGEDGDGGDEDGADEAPRHPPA